MAIDPLSAVSFGVGGLAELLKGIGVFPDPQDAKNKAMYDYLQNNTSDFNYTPQNFDPSKYQDILQPLAQQQQVSENATGNKLGMQGLGRSGYAQAVTDINNRNDAQNMANTEVGLARNEDNTAFQRQLATYNANLQRQSMLAGLKG